jgi:O-succinylbenzoate synthase
MLESGIGRAHNIAMSTLAGFSLPGDVSASQRYWTEDIIEPEVEVTPRGTIEVPKSPGIGYSAKRDRVEKLTVRRKQWGAHVTKSIRMQGDGQGRTASTSSASFERPEK